MFTVTDPLGKKVTLKASTWERHITVEHPEMLLYFEELKNLIRDPYYIIPDLIEDPNRPGQKVAHETKQEYFDVIPGKHSSRFTYIRAIVDHSTNPGEIVTALVSSKGPIGTGGVLYVRPK